MHPGNVIAIAVALGMDAMSVCLAIGVRWHGPGQKFRLAFHMGLFQFFMPVVGWYLGQAVASLVSGVGKYIASAMVFAVGVKMLYEVVKKRPGALAEAAEHAAEKELHIHVADPTRGLSLVLLSLATSIDALVVGFSVALASQGDNIWQVSIVIGIVAAIMSLMGVVLGRRIGQALGKWAEAFGAVVLMLLGVCFLWM